MRDLWWRHRRTRDENAVKFEEYGGVVFPDQHDLFVSTFTLDVPPTTHLPPMIHDCEACGLQFVDCPRQTCPRCGGYCLLTDVD